MAKKKDIAPPIGMNMMGLLLFDEEDTKIRLDGRNFEKIVLIISIILFVVSAVLH